MGCAYAEGGLDKCTCICKGFFHGLLAPHSTPRVECSPAARVRCHQGNEDGECKCACKGANHGLYQDIDDFESIPVINVYN